MEPAAERGFVLISCPHKERCCHRANIAHIKLKHRCVLVRESKKESRWGGGVYWLSTACSLSTG